MLGRSPMRALIAFCCLGVALAQLAVAAAERAGAAPPSAASAPEAKRSRRFINGVADTGQFLPDSAMLARVDDHVIRVREFIESYFNAFAEDRPAGDSAGRVEFLDAMINKQVLGKVARSIPHTFGFEDRLVMRQHTERVLANTLYQRVVVDSVVLGDDEIRRVYEQYKVRLRLWRIQLADRATAERVRRELLAGRIAWKDAVKRYSIARTDRGPEGDMGWMMRVAMSVPLGEAIAPLKPGEISAVIEDENGFNIVKCVDRTPTAAPAFESMRNNIRDQLFQYQAGRRFGRLQDVLAAQVGLVTDSASIAWASSFFAPPRTSVQEAGGTNLVINAGVPEFSPADTARILARYRGGVLSLGGFLDFYQHIQALVRPPVNTYEDLRAQVRNLILEPTMAQAAVERGLDKDPSAVAQLELKREQILVERMYQDSVMSKVLVSPEERRRYYDEHRTGYVTFASVRYASFLAHSRAGADSMAAVLRGGVKAEDILRADSLEGILRGSIRDRRADEHGPYQKVLLEELKPGQVTVDGPDKSGDFVVLQSLAYEPGRQLSYAEAQEYVYESVQNLKAEKLLQELIARHRRSHRIESHPELVTRIRLVDPTL